MSVNVGQRNVPDTERNRRFDAGEKAMDLALHTIKICSNKNVFDAEYQEALTDDIIRCAKDVYIYAWRGNKVYVNDNASFIERKNYQLVSISKCDELLALINMAKRLFHLKGKKVHHWIKLTVTARKYLKAWYRSTVEESWK